MTSNDSIKRRPKITEINVVRAFAILAVIMIHSTSEATIIPASGSFTQKLFYSINTFGAYAVPVFIFISGLVLFYSYFDRWKAANSFKFYGKRLISVVYPYLAFSLFYYLFYQFQNSRELSFHLGTFLKQLPWGDASYHLYFMIIIFQFYLLFPFLITLAKSSRLFARGLALLGLIVQVGYYVVTYSMNLDVPHGPSLFITYFAVFLIGAWVGIHYAAVSAWIRRYWLLLVTLFIMIGALYIGMLWSGIYYKVHIEGYWYRTVYNAFAISAAIALIGFGKWLIERAPKLAKPVLRLGQVSFGVYLLHPAVLSTFKSLFKMPGSTVAFSLYVVASFIVTVAVTWLIVEGYYKIKQTILPSKGKAKTSVGKSA